MANIDEAASALDMTPQEKRLYERHLANLSGPGGVDNADGSRSTLFQMSIEHAGKVYNVPTVWDGKILQPDDAIKQVEKEGWDAFPSYQTEQEAESRYQQMHDFMERDTQDYLEEKKRKDFDARSMFPNSNMAP